MKQKSGTVRDAQKNKNQPEAAGMRPRAIVPKILCLLAAFVLWIYVMQVESPEYTETISSVPVQIENATRLQSDTNLSIYSGSNQYINVSISGKKSVINNLSADDIRAFVDVSTISEAGRHSLDVYVELPDSVSLVKPSPSAITVFADETSVVSLGVTEKLEKLVLTSPYELGQIDLEYNTITVTGPKNKVSTIAGAQVNIDMDGKTSSFKASCPISLYGTNGEAIDTTYLTMSITEMNVEVPIYVTKELPIATEFKYGLLDSKLVSVTCSPETVTVRGDESVFVDETSLTVPVVIDEKQIKDNVYTMKVRPTFTGDITVDPSDEEVLITVELDTSLRTKTYNVTDIQVTGASDEIKYELLDSSVSVTLRGNITTLNKIKNSDISVLVDLSGYDSDSSGTISKSATVVIDAEDTSNLFEIGTYSVQVKIN